MRKLIAYTLMLIGFAWIAIVCLDLLVALHHTLWICHVQNLPPGDMIPRGEAIDQMRSLELAIQDVYQPLVIPAFMIVVGGILNGTKRGEPTEQASRA